MKDLTSKEVKNIPKIIKLNQPSTDKEILLLKSQMYKLKEIFNFIDRVGMAAGQENLSLQVAIELGEALRIMCRPNAKNSIRVVQNPKRLGF